jgi:hypothetical protein
MPILWKKGKGSGQQQAGIIAWWQEMDWEWKYGDKVEVVKMRMYCLYHIK